MTTSPESREKKRYSTGGSSKKYYESFFSESDCVVSLSNYDPFDQQALLMPDEVVISSKNLFFEKHNGENHLLSSLKYTLRVCTVDYGLSKMCARVELVCGNTDTPIYCIKKDKKGKRGIKGRCYQDFEVSKHGYAKAKLEFRFRETSSDNLTDKFRLNVHIYSEETLMLTFKSPRFRVVVRSPQRGKFKILREQLGSSNIVVPYQEEGDNDEEEGRIKNRKKSTKRKR